MPIKRTGRMLSRGLRRALRVVARPARRRGRQVGLVIQPYRGYGTGSELYLLGRAFRQPKIGTWFSDESVAADVAHVVRRVVRWGVGGAQMTARFGRLTHTVETDRDGYFEIKMKHDEKAPRDRLWHELELTLEHREETVVERGEVFIPPESCRYVVVSDIDDTVMLTGVVNKLRMMYRLFVQQADSRVAFPGVAAFYRALHHGRSGSEKNPMLYVSRAPWSIYEVLEEFFNLHRIPHGPILFLREWGLSIQRPLPKRGTRHKQDLIEDMLARYDELPFILIGDSGQHDPEVYAQVVRDFPGRVLAVYIRNVSRKAARAREIDELAAEIERQGSSLVLATDTLAMAEHAASMGLIPASEVALVTAEQQADEPSSVHQPAERVPAREASRASMQSEADNPKSVIVQGDP